MTASLDALPVCPAYFPQEALARRVPNSIANNAIANATYSALSPDGGGSWSLAHALPRQLVNELLMGGERMGAQRLHELGVVNRLCDAGQALGTALDWAEKLAARAPNVLTSIKELVSEAPAHSLNAHLAMERDHFVTNLHHANGGIGIAAFLAKQTPRYE